MDVGTAILLLVAIVLVKFLFKADPPPVNGVYSQPGKWYWLKFRLFKILLGHRKNQQHKKISNESAAGYGRKSRNSPEEMDIAQELPKEHPKAVDAVYLTGSNKDGQFLVTATARRHDNHVQTIVYLRLPDLGFLELPSMPDTSLRGSLPGEYAAGGLHIRSVEPMKKWNIKFDGKLRQVSSGDLLDVKFDLTWTACTRYFDFDVDLNHDTLADAIAREPWSRRFFDTLKTIHQTHYEQFGDTTGDVHVQGRPPYSLNVRGIRDHSYGNIRDWRQLHRYCIQYASFQDGSNLNISAISMPDTTSRLHCGFLFLPDGRLETMSSCDLEFERLGDDGNHVTNFTINFVAGGRHRTLEAEVLDWRQFYIGDGRDAKIFERYVRYSLDGVEGFGLSEWEYVNKDGTEPQNNFGLNV